MSVFGMAGSSGTGKTTLTRMVAESLGIDFIPTSITEGARKHGFDAVGNLNLEQRLELQIRLLADHQELLQSMKRPAILDRTPLDMAGYLMCEVNMHSHLEVTPGALRTMERYVEDCLQTVRAHYDAIFVLGPLKTYQNDPKRPAANPAYHRHHELVIKGCVMDLRAEVSVMNIAGESLEFRFDTVHDTIVARLDRAERARRKNPALH